MALSPDGKHLASVEYPDGVRLWDVATGRELRRWHQADIEAHEGPRFSPDGRFLATKLRRVDLAAGKLDRSINLWEIAATSERRRLLRGEWHEIWTFAFSRDGRSLTTVNVDEQRPQGPDKGSIRVFDLDTLRETRRMPVEVVNSGLVAFSPDGKLLAAAGSDQFIHLHDLATGQEHGHRLELEPASPEIPLPPWGFFCLAFSPDGSILATGEFKQQAGLIPEASIRVWDVAQGRALRRIPVPQQWVRSMSFSPDGKTLASCSTEAGLRLWDVASGREVMPLPGHRSAIRTLVVSPADGTVVTGGQDGTIRHWDPATGRELGLITIFDTPVDSLAIAPDGQRLLVGQIKGRRLALWSVAEPGRSAISLGGPSGTLSDMSPSRTARRWPPNGGYGTPPRAGCCRFPRSGLAEQPRRKILPDLLLVRRSPGIHLGGGRRAVLGHGHGSGSPMGRPGQAHPGSRRPVSRRSLRGHRLTGRPLSEGRVGSADRRLGDGLGPEGREPVRPRGEYERPVLLTGRPMAGIVQRRQADGPRRDGPDLGCRHRARAAPVSGHDGPVNVVAFAPTDARSSRAAPMAQGSSGTSPSCKKTGAGDARPGVLKAHWDQLAGADAPRARATWAWRSVSRPLPAGTPPPGRDARSERRPVGERSDRAARDPEIPPRHRCMEYAGTPAARARSS